LRLAAVGGCWKTQKDISICNSNIYHDKGHELYYSRRLILYHASYRQRSHANSRGGLGNEFFPLGRNEFMKKKRTIYRKLSHEN